MGETERVLFVNAIERERLCVCVCEREYEREMRKRENPGESMCVRKIERFCSLSEKNEK